MYIEIFKKKTLKSFHILRKIHIYLFFVKYEKIPMYNFFKIFSAKAIWNLVKMLAYLLLNQDDF